MKLISFTPKECFHYEEKLHDKVLKLTNSTEHHKNDILLNQNLRCEQLSAFMRILYKQEKKEEAMMQFYTTIFTCVVLCIASLTVSNDIEVIVIIPVKKIVDIIQRLAEGPLKKPQPPSKPDRNSEQMKMKTKMLEQTIFKIGTLL